MLPRLPVSIEVGTGKERIALTKMSEADVRISLDLTVDPGAIRSARSESRHRRWVKEMSQTSRHLALNSRKLRAM